MKPRDVVIAYPARGARSRIRVASGALARLGASIGAPAGTRVVVVSEPRVAALYAPAVLASLRRARLDGVLVCVPTGERAKSATHLARLWESFAAAGLDRWGRVVALGGGAVGDLAGFAAATWLRGVEWVGVPTSLLAQVDASVGGKTAIDVPAGKNLAGAFHQPRLVVADPQVLATLPRRHVRAGLAEVVKIGIATDAALFRWVERHAEALAAGDPERLGEAVLRAVRAKARIVRRDERETEGGVRTALNLGHTTAHAIESAMGYRGVLHGEAVAIGLRVAARLSVANAGLPSADARRIEALLDRLGLPQRLPAIPIGRLRAAMQRDKKARNGMMRWVLTPRMGHASVPRLIPGRRIEAVLREAGARR